MRKSILHVNIDSELKAEAEALAERLGVSMTVVVTAILRKFIADRGVEIKEYASSVSVSNQEEGVLKIPSANTYLSALKDLNDNGKLQPWMKNMLITQYNSPSHKISSIEFAKKLKYGSYAAINIWYHRMAKLIARKMKVSYRGKIPAEVLSKFEQENVSGYKKMQWILTMHPEVVEALKKLGLVK